MSPGEVRSARRAPLLLLRAEERSAGALLRDVLSKWGVKEESLEGLHCHFECSAAPCEDDSFYGASIPLAVAMRVSP